MRAAPETNGLVIGYGNTEAQRLGPAVKELAELVREMENEARAAARRAARPAVKAAADPSARPRKKPAPQRRTSATPNV
jgi:GntR family transcriptional regulator/MocR family aminotransferase